MTVNNGDILKLTFEVTLNDGTIAQNVYHLEARFAAGQSDATVRNEVESWIEAAYSELSPDHVSTITQGLCQLDEIQWNATKSQWEVVRNVGTFTPTIGYNNAGEALPNMSVGFVTFNTSRPKSRGRKFLFPFGEAQQAGTYLVGATVTNMVDFAGRILTAVVIGPGNTLVYGIVRATVEQFLEALVGVVTNVMGTQRRRRPGVGV